jgi:chondroitin AC lyase
VDHGPQPQNASYEYIVVPGIVASSIDNCKKKSEVAILANTPEVQAVQHKGLQRTEIVFYKAGAVKLSDGLTVKVEAPCMVMITTNGKTIERLAVFDPTHKLKSIQLEVDARVEAKGNHWQSTWNKEKKASVIQIKLSTEGYAGSNAVLQLNSGFNKWIIF